MAGRNLDPAVNGVSDQAQILDVDAAFEPHWWDGVPPAKMPQIGEDRCGDLLYPAPPARRGLGDCCQVKSECFSVMKP
jgi:hypothetical protein